MVIVDKRLIALYGYPGCGKDTLARRFVEQGWSRVAFADPIKEMLIALDPYVEVHDNLDPSDPECWPVRLSYVLQTETLEEAKRKHSEVRRLLQRLGSEAGRDILGKDVWANIALDRIAAGMRESAGVVITDMRFPNEYQLVCGLGGIVVHVKRPGTNGMSHSSEQHYGTFDPHLTVHNVGSEDDLLLAADGILQFVATL